MVEVVQRRGERRCRGRWRRGTIWGPAALEDGCICRLGPLPGVMGVGSHCFIAANSTGGAGGGGSTR